MSKKVMKSRKARKQAFPAALALLTGIAPTSIAMAGSVSGTIYAPVSGTVPQNVPVTLHKVIGGSIPDVTVNTDVYGNYSIPNVASGWYTVAVGGAVYASNQNFFNVDNADVVFENVYSQNATATLTVTVNYSNGSVAAGVYVNLRDKYTGNPVLPNYVLTDSTGKASLVNVPTLNLQNLEYELDIKDGSGNQIVSPVLFAWVSNSTDSASTYFTIPANVSSSVYGVQGTLISSSNGQPAPGVSFAVYNENPSNPYPYGSVAATVYSDAYGNFSVPANQLPAHDYVISGNNVSYEEFYLPTGYEVVLGNDYYYGSGFSSPVTNAATVTVTGKVVDANGQPLSNASVSIYNEYSDRVIVTGLTDQNGNYSIQVSGNNTVQVAVSLANYRTIETGSLYLRGNTANTVTIPTLTMVYSPNGSTISTVTSGTTSTPVTATTPTDTATTTLQTGLVSSTSSMTDLSTASTVTVSSTGVAQVSVDSTKAVTAINAAAAGTSDFVFAVAPQSNATEASLSVTSDVVQAAATKAGASATFVIATQFGNYALPVQVLGASNGKVTVTISQADASTSQTITATATTKGFKVVGTPLTFNVTATDSTGNTKAIESFGNTYVARSVNVGAIDPAHSVGVMVNADGSLSPVPTLFVQQKDGSYVAVMNRTGNSTYAVVTGTKTFNDIQGSWAQSDIEKMASHLLVNGETDSAFAPGKDISRGEFISILVRALGIGDRSASSAFTDVSASDWFANAVNVAASAGLVSGYSDGTFKPNQSITREEMAALLSRAMTFANQKANASSDLSKFKDGTQVAGWATSAVSASIQAGILNGDENGNLRPSSNATRAESAVMLERLMKYLKFLN